MMLSRILMPVVALSVAGAATYLARGWLESRRLVDPAPAVMVVEPVTKGVLVAGKRLDVGQFIQPSDVRWQEWPDVSTPEGYLVEGASSIDDVVGSVLRRPAAAGEPILADNFVKPGERGFLAAVLDPDMRAISVPVDEASSNAGLIFPGDQVDLILTQSLGEPGGPEATRRVSETVLEDVRVLAMGRRLTAEDTELGSSNQIRTTTLEVTPAGAEKVALVTELGKLSLSLRSLARRSPEAEPRPAAFRATWDADVSPALRPENQPRTTLAVIRGGEAQTLSIPRGAPHD